ncbi:MAG: right-handed parallel beta-helix repeat-containing protein, partial [Prolixibacteraceae bacterium]|nr:right-handed parallel beta-helix repeat-containing protein [Prolixibacteraceae bacterium]
IVQRVKTTGQLNEGNVSIDKSYFSDFPNDSQEYLDNDNDGIYLKAIDATITNSMIMYAKDDGIDSGGNEGGNVTLSNCVIEACFHEGIAMSSEWPSKKKHSITACKIINCQQGIELGYSSSYHTVDVDNCTISGNYIGVRLGDCYDRKVHGKLTLRNSRLSNNEKNTWNMVRQKWKANTSNFILENNVTE